MTEQLEQVGPDLTDHFMTDLQSSTLLVAPERCLLSAPLADALRAGDSVAAGVLVTLVDVASCQPALVAGDPDWTATQDLSLHRAGPLTQGPVVLDCRLVRVGRKTAVVRTDVHDGLGEHDLPALREALDRGELPHAASALTTFARLPRTAARAEDAQDFDPASWVGLVRRAGRAGRRTDRSLAERMDVRVLDAAAGRLELDRTPYVLNSIGTINGGSQAVLAQLAAEQVLPDLVAVDLQMHFLAQTRTGPARTAVRVLRGDADGAVVEVGLHDAGAQDLLLSRAVVTLRRPRGA